MRLRFWGSSFVICFVLGCASAQVDPTRDLAANDPKWFFTRDDSGKAAAEAIIDRLDQLCGRSRSKTDQAKPLIRKTQIFMMVPSNAVPAIARLGFQNVHNSLAGNQAPGRESTRFEVEQELAGSRLPYDFRSRAILPKYAYLDFLRPGHRGDEVPSYGEVAFVFQNSVKARTTWTRSDTGGAVYTDLFPLPDRPARTFHDAMSADEFAHFKCTGYCEAQIWGPLDLRDISYAMIKPGSDALAALRANGVKTYEYRVPKHVIGRNMAIERGKLLYEGDARLVPAADFGDGTLDLAIRESNPFTGVHVAEGYRLASKSTGDLIQEWKRHDRDEQVSPGHSVSWRTWILAELSTRPDFMDLDLLEDARTKGDILSKQIAYSRIVKNTTSPPLKITWAKNALRADEWQTQLWGLALSHDLHLKPGISKLKNPKAIVAGWYHRIFEKGSTCPR